jgi:tetratricopeptide (TPR) repeat protein
MRRSSQFRPPWTNIFWRIFLRFSKSAIFRAGWRHAWRSALVTGCIVVVVFGALNIVTAAQSSELIDISTIIKSGNLKEAEQRLNGYRKTHPGSVKANTLLATVYLRQGRFELAEPLLKQTIAQAPRQLEPRVTLADAYGAAGKLDLALTAYQEAAKISPADPHINLSLAKLYLGKGEFAKSIAAAGNIPAAQRTTEILPTLAADYLGLQQPDKAAVEVRAMLEVAGKQVDLVPELAELFLAHRDFQSAERLLTSATKQPHTDRFQIDLALTQAGLGQLDLAQTTLEGVLEHAPGSVPALVAAGQVASQQLNWTAAEEAFSRADGLAPNRPDILFGLVSAELYGFKPESALQNAQHLHSLAPDDLRSTYLLALALFGAKKGEEAKPYAEKVLTTHPDDREMHLILADVALNNDHDLPSARRHAEVCLKSNPNDPGGLYYLGMGQKMEGDLEGAIQSLSKSVAQNPKNANAQAALGAIYLQAGDLDGATRALEQAVLIAPEDPQSHYQLALAYSRAGTTDKAKIQLDLYKQIKTKQAKESGNQPGPSTSEVPPVKLYSHP